MESIVIMIDQEKEYFEVVEKQFKTADKGIGASLLNQLTSMKYEGTTRVKEHILKMTNLVARLKDLDMCVSKG